MKTLIGLFWLALVSSVFAQSTNLKTSMVQLNAADFQAKAEKNIAGGYPGLDGSLLISPHFIFPGFADPTPIGTFWVKTGTNTMGIQPGVAVTPDTITVDGVTIGQFGAPSLQFGISTIAGSNKTLIITSEPGVPNVFVGNGKTFGGANPAYSGFSWQIDPAGVFILGGGSFSGALDLNGQNMTDIGIASGGVGELSINFNSGAVTSTGTVSFAGVPAGVIVPNTGSLINSTHALNTDSAGAMFAETNGANVFLAPHLQTFLGPVSFINGSIHQDDIGGLGPELLSLLKLDGTRPMVGNLDMGSNRIVDVAAPVDDGDAINKLYLNSIIASDTVTSLTATAPLAVSPVSPAQGDITISIPEADDAGTNGFLSSADFAIFQNKQNSLTPVGPIYTSGSDIGINTANASQDGAISAVDWNRFDDLITELPAGYVWRGTGGGVEAIPYSPSNVFLSAITASNPTSVPFDNNSTTPGPEIFTHTMVANTLAVGSVIKVTVIGRYGFGANGVLVPAVSGSAPLANRYMQASLKIGGIGILLVDSPVAVIAGPTGEPFGNPVFFLEMTMTMRSSGPGATGAAVGEFRLVNANISPSVRSKSYLAVPTSTPIDTGVSNTVTVNLRNANADPNDEFQVDQAFITIN